MRLMTSLARLAALRICACQVLFEPGLNHLRVQSNYSDAGIFRPQLGERNCDVVVTVLRSGAFPRLFLPIDGCSRRNDRFDPATLAANVMGHGALTNRKARGNSHLVSRFERGLCVRLVSVIRVAHDLLLLELHDERPSSKDWVRRMRCPRCCVHAEYSAWVIVAPGAYRKLSGIHLKSG
jgi:hypothetical protein